MRRTVAGCVADQHAVPAAHAVPWQAAERADGRGRAASSGAGAAACRAAWLTVAAAPGGSQREVPRSGCRHPPRVRRPPANRACVHMKTPMQQRSNCTAWAVLVKLRALTTLLLLLLVAWRRLVEAAPGAVGGMLPYAVPVLADRLERQQEAALPLEPSEELRLACVRLLALLLR
eukprot:scaffold1621_cov350-Prasinococcus_capsulatus_cf.AAC.15